MKEVMTDEKEGVPAQWYDSEGCGPTHFALQLAQTSSTTLGHRVAPAASTPGSTPACSSSIGAREQRRERERDVREHVTDLHQAASRVVTIADEAFGIGPVEPLEATLTRIERGIFEQRQEIERMRPVVAAAERWFDEGPVGAGIAPAVCAYRELLSPAPPSSGAEVTPDTESGGDPMERR